MLLALGATPMPIEGDGRCPTPHAVSARLAMLSPSVPGHHATLDEVANGIEVALYDARGVELARRVLSGTCEGLLEAVAATLSAWEATYLTPPRAPLSVPSAQPATPSVHGLRWALAVSGALQIAAASPRPGLAIDFDFSAADSVWFARGGLSSAWPFRAPLLAGTVNWARPWFEAGLGLRVVDTATWAVTAALTADAALIVAWGEGFETNQRAVSFDPGFGLSGRLSRALWSGLWLFAGLEVHVAPLGQVAQVSGITATFSLPAATFVAQLGLAWGSSSGQ
jgi:hypothetical protein